MLSDFVRFALCDERGQHAQLFDVAIDLAAGDYSPATRLFFRRRGKTAMEVPWESVRAIDWRRRRVTIADLSGGRTAPPEALTRSVLVKRHVMDALAIDVANRQVVRINDLWLHHEDDRLWLRAADISPWAVLRRLGRGLLGRGADRHLLDWKDVEFLRGDPRAARVGQDYHRRVERLQPAEIARLLDALPYLHAAELLTLISDPRAADTLEAMSPQRQKQVFLELDEDQACRLLALMAPENAADLLGCLDTARAERYLGRVPEPQRGLVVELLRYPDDTAGGMMTNDVVMAPGQRSVREARELLREQLREPDFVYYVYVVNNLEERQLLGEVTLRRLLVAGDEQRLEEAMRPVATTIDPLLPADEAARKVAERQLAALPVVTREGRLLGAITADAAFLRIAPASVRGEAPRVFS